MNNQSAGIFHSIRVRFSGENAENLKITSFVFGWATAFTPTPYPPFCPTHANHSQRISVILVICAMFKYKMRTTNRKKTTSTR